MGYLGGGASNRMSSRSPGQRIRRRVKDSSAGASSGRVNSTPVLGGSMRIGNRLGGVLVWALAATMSVAAGAQTAERVTTVPLGGSLDGQTGDRYFGVYVPTRFGGELTIKATLGSRWSELKGPEGAILTNGQDIGLDQQGWYTFKVEGAKKPYTVETTFVQVGQSVEAALELLLLADQGRLDPRALGRRQRPG